MWFVKLKINSRFIILFLDEYIDITFSGYFMTISYVRILLNDFGAGRDEGMSKRKKERKNE